MSQERIQSSVEEIKLAKANHKLAMKQKNATTIKQYLQRDCIDAKVKSKFSRSTEETLVNRTVVQTYEGKQSETEFIATHLRTNYNIGYTSILNITK
jgi:hypothetical protein